MYAKRPSLQEFRQENANAAALRQQAEVANLRAFSLQQKNIAAQEETARAQKQIQILNDQLAAEKSRAKQVSESERTVKYTLQGTTSHASELVAKLEAEKKRTQEARDAEQASRTALQEKNAQMDKLMTQVNSLTGQLSDVQTRAGKLQIEQEGIRNELRSANARTITAPTPQIQPASEQTKESNRFIVLSPDMVEKNSTYRHVPYVFEITPATRTSIIKDTVYYHYIEDDESRGLGSPGRTGYIKNDGAGDITYRLFNKQQDTWSYPAVLRAGEADVFEYGDNIRVNTVEIIPDSNGTMYRLRFSPGIEQVFKEAEVKAGGNT